MHSALVLHIQGLMQEYMSCTGYAMLTGCLSMPVVLRELPADDWAAMCVGEALV